MDHPRLRPIPLRKRLESVEVDGRGNTATFSRADGVVDFVDAPQIVNGKVGRLPEIDLLVEVVNVLIVELV